MDQGTGYIVTLRDPAPSGFRQVLVRVWNTGEVTADTRTNVKEVWTPLDVLEVEVVRV